MRRAIAVLLMLAACGGEDETPGQTYEPDEELEQGAACGKVRHNCANGGRCGYDVFDGITQAVPTCLARCTTDYDCGNGSMTALSCDMRNPDADGIGWCGYSAID